MSGRSSFATPTNVYPKNGQVIVFNDRDEAWLSFTNNTDSLMFTLTTFYNIDTKWENYSMWHFWYTMDGDERKIAPQNRGETSSFRIVRYKWALPEIIDHMDVYSFEYGGHYSYEISQFSSFPRTVDDETVYVPNISVKKCSGRILEVISDTKIRIADHMAINIPTYYGIVGTDPETGKPTYGYTTYPRTNTYVVYCDYIEVYGKQAMITNYDRETGECELFNALTPIWTSPMSEMTTLTKGVPYSIYCNYIDSSGSSTEGVYDFYVRQKIQSASNADPVPGAFRCLCLYDHPDNIGLEKYRFKVYEIIEDDDPQTPEYINGTIQSWEDEETGINKGCDYKHIPIEKNLGLDLKNKRIIIGKTGETGRLLQGDWGEIVNYDNASGLVTLKREMEMCPAEGQPYTIELSERTLLADSGDCYSWRLAYNFPLYLMGKKIQLETILTTYEKQVSDICTTIMFPEPELHYDYGQDNNDYSIIANSQNQTVELTFKESIKNDTRFFGLYRKTRSTVMDDNLIDKWEYIGFIRGGNKFTDYLAANNSTYDYLISKTVKFVNPYPDIHDPDFDLLHEFDYDPSVEYQAHAFENAVSTKWDGWSITAIYPCENDYISDPIDAVKTDNGHFVVYDGEYKSTIAQFVCSKTPYKVGDTWLFQATIDSGDITLNLNRNTHIGTSTYPTISGTNNKFETGTFTTDLVTLECSTDTIYDNIEKVNKWKRFISDDCLYILKSDKGDVWIIAISDNPSRSYDESVEDIITKVSYSWTEVDAPENIQIVEY